MEVKSSTNNLVSESLKTSIILSCILFVSFTIGILFPLEIALDKIISLNPLPKYYFPLFLLIGLILPVVIRIENNKKHPFREPLNSYLILLVAQILNEITYTLIIGKATSVIVGFLFTLCRLSQIRKIIIRTKENGLKRLFSLLLILWSINIFNIFFNRLLPLINHQTI